MDDISNIEINNVVLLDTNAAADLYMEKLFPLWSSVIVVSLEGKYPLNQDLKNRVFENLSNNTNLSILIFGAQAEKFETASQKRMNMQSLFRLDLRRYPWEKPVFEFDEYKITELCRAFCDSPDKNRLQSYNSFIDAMIPESVKWYHDLVR